MFSKLTALCVLVPLVSALQLTTPSGLSSGGSATIQWTNEAGDASTFSLELVNTAFHNSFAIANNVQPGSGSLTLNLPSVPPGDGYTIEAVNITNIGQVFAQTSDFSIGAQSSTTSSSSTSGAASGSSSSGVTIQTSTGVASSTSAVGSTVTNPSTSATGTASGSSSAASASGSSFNGAAGLSFTGSSSYTLALLGVVAGAAVVAL